MPNKDNNSSNRERKKNTEKKNNLMYSSKHVRNKEKFLLQNKVDINKDTKDIKYIN